MSIISSKTGILCLINIVVACVVIGTLTDVAIGKDAVALKGNYNYLSTTGGVALLVIACVSLVLHILAVASSFMGDESSLLKMNFFFLNQIVISVVYFGASVAFLVLIEYVSKNIPSIILPDEAKKNINIQRTACSFGLIGFVLNAVTAFLAKKEM